MVELLSSLCHHMDIKRTIVAISNLYIRITNLLATYNFYIIFLITIVFLSIRSVTVHSCRGLTSNFTYLIYNTLPTDETVFSISPKMFEYIFTAAANRAFKHQFEGAVHKGIS